MGSVDCAGSVLKLEYVCDAGCEGVFKEGEVLSVHLSPPGGKAMTFMPKEIRVRDQQEFRWLGHVLIPGIFDGEHIFEIEELGEKRTRFVQRGI